MAKLLPPAIAYAEEGFKIRPHSSDFWNLPPTAGRNANITMVNKLPATRKIYCKNNGSVLAVGHVLRNPDMGQTLLNLAQQGIGHFYTRHIAPINITDMEAHGGSIWHADLATCAPEQNAPLWGT